MLIYAGIDESGYGPLFGPLLVGRTVMAVHDHRAATPPRLWNLLKRAVCRTIAGSNGRIVVNDSKRVHSAAVGIKHLELGVLTFAGVAGLRPATVDRWLEGLGDRCHDNLRALPWYAPGEDQPWGVLPRIRTAGEVAVARNLLATTMQQRGVEMLDLAAAVVLEDRFNRMTAATRSKAATSFTFVAKHLLSIWQRFGKQAPLVVVDRQSGRLHYRELLSLSFPDVGLTVLEESESSSSVYYLDDGQTDGRKMTIRFEVDAESRHMPVALASMVSKYTRELFMERFKEWFTSQAPHVKPTAGYAQDAKRFWQQIQPVLAQLAIEPDRLRRIR